MTEEKEILENYPYQIAGNTWVIPQVCIHKSHSGHVVFPGREVTRMNHFVAKEICGSHSPLKGQELDFLCDLTTTKYVEIAAKLGVAKGTVSKLISKDDHLSISQSVQLKKWFWAKIFGIDRLENVPAILIFDENKLLDYLKKEAEKSEFLKAI